MESVTILDLMNRDIHFGTITLGTEITHIPDEIALLPCTPTVATNFAATNFNFADNNFVTNNFTPRIIRNIDGFGDDNHEIVNKLLQQIQTPLDIILAENAMNIIKQHQLTGFDHHSWKLIYFPDLLYDFLSIHTCRGSLISINALSCMISMCIEYTGLFVKSDASQSLISLINFKGDMTLEIKLLPGKYPIDPELYSIAKHHGISDVYYDQTTTYMLPYSLIIHRSNEISDFRDAYHILLYGTPTHLQSLIVRWDMYGEDSTFNAAKEYFQLPPETLRSEVINKINMKCSL